MPGVFTTSALLLKVYGSRGSLPTPQRDRMEYGGNTSCFTIFCDNRLLVLDCGTGAMPLCRDLADLRPSRIDLLFSHMHLDHTGGVPFFEPLFSSEYPVTVHGETRDGLSIRQQVSSLLSAPQWPFGAERFQPALAWNDFACGDCLDLDGIIVKTMRSRHPNQCTLYRVQAHGKSVVYALDYEHGDCDRDLLAFARGCDVLVYDAQFTDEEYSNRIGWGHSTWQKGVELARECGVQALLLSHHAPGRTDAELAEMDQSAQSCFAGATFAKEGQVIAL